MTDCIEVNEYPVVDSIQGVYFIHNNGGRPYKVTVNSDESNTSVHVYKLIENFVYEPEPILTFNPTDVFIGCSPLIKMTIFSGGHGAEFDGNTILLCVGHNEYVSISEPIFSFKSVSKIVSYVSPIGNSDVPYPYAVDDQNNIYLLIEDVIIKHNTKVSKQMKSYDDPYAYYYDHNLICSYEDPVRNKSRLVGTAFENIKSFYEGSNKYTLRYSAPPEKHCKTDSPMFVVDTAGKKTLLTEDMYIQSMKLFATASSFEPLNSVYFKKN